MLLALQNRQAVIVRANPAFKDLIAIKKQVLRRERGGNPRIRFGHKLRCLFGGDVLKHSFEFGQAPLQRHKHALDEHGFAVKHIHRWVCHFAVQQERHIQTLHRLQRGLYFEQIGYARI